jgi:hypothetical protein
VDGLRGTLVFVDQAAEQVAAADAIKIDQFGRGSFAPRQRLTERRPLPEGAVRAMFVVVPRVARENALQVAAADDQEPVEAFRRTRPIQRSACARAFGARTGALMTWIPSERKTSSNSRVNLPSRSRIRKLGRTPSSSSCISRLRACWLTQPPSGLVVTPAR